MRLFGVFPPSFYAQLFPFPTLTSKLPMFALRCEVHSVLGSYFLILGITKVHHSVAQVLDYY